jgi:hypothetical protein
MKRLLAALGCCAGAALAQTDCAPPAAGTQVLRDAETQVQWRPLPAPIVVGQPFALEILVCPAAAELMRVDATMPEHRHGMNYRPSIQALGGGRWRVQGLLWHMSGRWELRLDLKVQGQERQLRQSVQLP